MAAQVGGECGTRRKGARTARKRLPCTNAYRARRNRERRRRRSAKRGQVAARRWPAHITRVARQRLELKVERAVLVLEPAVFAARDERAELVLEARAQLLEGDLKRAVL